MSDPLENTTTPEALQLANFLTYRMARVQAKLNAQGARLLREVAGLTLTQWRIIFLVARADDTRSSEITRAFEIDKGLLSRNLKTLIADGLIKSRTDETDHRAHNLTLTDEGRRLFEETLPHMQKRQAGLRTALTEQELTTFQTALNKLESALDTEPGT